VTPYINKEGYVQMKIRPVVSSVGSRIKTTASPDGVPIVKTSEAETSILVRDGMTIVMGGLMEDKVSKNMTKIPLLGDIPGIGLLFRNTSNETKKTELVILLTPTVISGDFVEPIPGMKGSSIYRENYYEGAKENVLSNVLYYQDVRGKILNAATKFAAESQNKITGEAIVSFSLASDGSLSGEPALINEVQPELAEVALRSVRDSAPFPPFPKLLRRDTENFKIRISFE
jgi:hypothetical protein